MTVKSKKAVIFGASGFAEVVSFYLEVDSPYEVVGFTASGEAIEDNQGSFMDKPLVAFEELESRFPAGDHELFVAVGYRKMNKIRESLMAEAKNKSYKLLSYISSKASHYGDHPQACRVGDNVFVFEDNTLQPFTSIGDGTILWSGNHIGHHTTIGKCNFISSHVVVSGHCIVGDRCFIGVNATIGDDVKIADENLIGAGALILKNTNEKEVFPANRTKPFSKTSDQFFQ